MAECFLRADLRGVLEEDSMLEVAAGLEGEVFRQVAGRCTKRVLLDSRWFFIKYHEGVGLAEIFKSWLSFKRPVIGARNEFEACRYLQQIGIDAPRVAAYAESGESAARRRSFVMCDELAAYEDLECVTNRWLDVAPDGREMRALVMQVAEFSRRFHAAGCVHRDFYLCHLQRRCDDPLAALAVLDLHRALRFDTLPWRWRKRDLAALLYSALDLPLERRAWLRFVRIYSGRRLREEFADNGRRWEQVYRRALALYRKGERKGLTRGNFQP